MPSTPPPAMPPGINAFDAELEKVATPVAVEENVSMRQLMQLMKQMTEMIIAEKASGGARSHLANAKLDDRNFKRIEKFSNKRDAWKE